MGLNIAVMDSGEEGLKIHLWMSVSAFSLILKKIFLALPLLVLR